MPLIVEMKRLVRCLIVSFIRMITDDIKNKGELTDSDCFIQRLACLQFVDCMLVTGISRTLAMLVCDGEVIREVSNKSRKETESIMYV